jgi:hypothetical protein
VGYYPPVPEAWTSVLKVTNLTRAQLEDAIGSLEDVEIQDLREAAARVPNAPAA